MSESQVYTLVYSNSMTFPYRTAPRRKVLRGEQITLNLKEQNALRGKFKQVLLPGIYTMDQIHEMLKNSKHLTPGAKAAGKIGSIDLSPKSGKVVEKVVPGPIGLPNFVPMTKADIMDYASKQEWFVGTLDQDMKKPEMVAALKGAVPVEPSDDELLDA